MRKLASYIAVGRCSSTFILFSSSGMYEKSKYNYNIKKIWKVKFDFAIECKYAPCPGIFLLNSKVKMTLHVKSNWLCAIRTLSGKAIGESQNKENVMDLFYHVGHNGDTSK